MGDWNARSIAWDARGNPRGNRLKSWVQRAGWAVTAPVVPTFAGPQEQSIIDLFVCSFCGMSDIATPSGKWDRSSDPISLTATIRPAGRIQAPRTARINIKLTQRFKVARSTQEIETAYVDFLETLTRPF